ncbi:MAG: TonB-dependent receptor [Proteobacteria bacterium]|nr:TonB-dependent receptor [Pseudomonadota bacterium]
MTSVITRLRACSALTSIAFALSVASAHAEDATPLPPVPVESPAPVSDAPLTATTIAPDVIRQTAVRSNDSASLFDDVAGMSSYQAGGVSSLPAIHGLADDRVLVLVDGMVVSVACPNHMNSPLSYIDPAQVGTATAVAGITPVSMGGDSIAGTIEVNSAAPAYSATGEIVTAAKVQAAYRSNGNAFSTSLSASVAGEDFNIAYTGAFAQSGNYDGGGHDGEVHSTEFETANHALTLAARSGAHSLQLTVGQQYLPYEAYPNQWMDMVFNRSAFVNGKYDGSFGWGTVEVTAYWQNIRHEMNFLDDKGGMAMGGMPMDTKSQNGGVTLKVTANLNERDTIRAGAEYRHMTLDDWWPPVAGSMMMGPLTYLNVVDGRRDRFGAFAEWDAAWTGHWSTLLGARGDFVSMNAGNVQPYSWTDMMSMEDAMAATAFNAVGHARNDSNLDVTALARYAAEDGATYEFGYARKTRSPNLYERYTWGRGAMSSQMIGWFGDGNGYVGNLDLKPEVANTVSASGVWKSRGDTPWEVKLSGYYTYVDNFIDATKLQDLMMMGMPSGFVQLQFVNRDAELYGVDLAGALRLWNDAETGTGTLRGSFSWVEGRDPHSDRDLYHIMPPNARLALDEVFGNWSGTLEAVLVAEKSRVDVVRNEPVTGGYALFNLRGGYDFGKVRVDAGIENLFDTAYALPLGGQSLGDYDATGILRPVPGAGRSFNIALTVGL